MNKEMINSVRREMNQRLRASGQTPARDSEMHALSRDQRDGPIAKLARNAMTIDGVVEILLQNRRDYGVLAAEPQNAASTAQMLNTRRTKSGSNRPRAVSEFVTKIAASREDVATFRSEILSDSLMKRDVVGDWIQRQASIDGAPTSTAVIILREKLSFDLGKEGVIPNRPIDVQKNPIQSIGSYGFLQYVLPQDAWVQKIPVCAGGVLDRLRIITERLADDYLWQAAQATMFVLTGLTPLISSVVAGYEPGSEKVLDRIRLVIDPEISPRQVEETYRKVSRHISSRTAPLSEKRLRLATFMRSRPSGETYKQAMRAWNRANPDAKYDAETNFGRDAKDAQEAVRPRTIGEKVQDTFRLLDPGQRGSR